MELDARDIEAIGKSRANRSIPRGIKYWVYGGIVVAMGGVIYWMYGGGWLGLGLAVVGLACLWYGSSLSTKRSKEMSIDLKRQWREEQKTSEKV